MCSFVLFVELCINEEEIGRGYGMHGEKKNVYKVMIGKHERRRTLERLRCGWECSIKMYLFREICVSHNSVDEGSSFLGCRTVSAGKYRQWRNVVLPSAGSGSPRQVAVLEIVVVQYR